MPAKFINNEGKEVGETSVLAAYFRKKDESLSEFSAQVKILSESDKTELAIGAAKELGWQLVP